MKKFFPLLIFVLILITFPSCGKKGPILPPLPKVVQEFEAFEISQRGEKLLLEWENPTAYTDGSPLPENSEVEIWLFKREGGETENKMPKPEEFEKGAVLLASIKQVESSAFQSRDEEGEVRFQYPYELTPNDFNAGSLVFGLRMKTKRKKVSEFSSLRRVKPQILSFPPRAVKAQVFQDRIEVSWTAAEKNIDDSSPAYYVGFNVYRSEGDAPARRLNVRPVKSRKYDDKDFLIGKTYRYFIRASATQSSPYKESSDSEVIEVTPEDTFPPAAPSGLISIVAEDFISLTWDENREEDLAGYRVWRKTDEEGEFRLLTPEPIHANAFNDTAVEPNKRYHYVVTALDEPGNESRKSKSVSEIIKDVFK
ncbi:MAG: hypothetical protein PVI11_07005 [Candidatus Aminicenantes bacterium]|jgi:predicted small lipoprotein YifL